MANLQIYADCTVLINNTLLSEHSTVTIDKKSGLNPVYNSEGFGGMSVGPRTVEITIETAIPSEGLQFNPDPYMVGEVVDFVGYLGGTTTAMETKGFITDASYTHGVNKESQLTMKLLCRFSDFHE